MNKYSIFSFFSGSGFLDLGFENSGFNVVLVNEYMPSFMKAYRYSREKMGLCTPQYGYFNIDINEFLQTKKMELSGFVKKEQNDGNLVGFIGGPPCPDFSIAGKNKGRDGDNGKLSQSFISIITEFKPDFFLFENVKGLWKTARHRLFYEELKAQLHSTGYVTTERLSNALEFGAPQDRDRILLFGIKSEVFNKSNLDDFPWEKYIQYSLEDIKKMPWPDCSEFSVDSIIPCPNGILKEITVQYWFDKNKVNTHPNSKDYFIPRGGISRMESISEGDVSKKSYKRLHRWRFSPTVAYGNNEVHLHPYKIRRLSAAEALALQTLPDCFELPVDMTLTDKFKTIGNGVPYVLSKGIAQTIKDYLDEIK